MKRTFDIGGTLLVRDDAGCKPEHLAVLDMLIDADGTAIHQSEIADRLDDLGHHPQFESDLAIANPKKTTNRKVRQIINDLRLTWHMPILSESTSRGGYWIPKTVLEVQAFMEGRLRMWDAEARSFMKTDRTFRLHIFPDMIDDNDLFDL